MFEAKAEAKASRPRPNFWGQDQNFGLEATLALSGLEDLTSLLRKYEIKM